ncbi:DinB family protein [Hyphobacterium sp. CCMP332]|nr:DinB family protein [Hyphobacterium sp. CCMP332]
MEFSLKKSIEILQNTPQTLKSYLSGLSEDWIRNNEGPDTWSPYDILGHLIHGEKTDWMDRVKIILKDSGNKKFTPFDRFAQFKENQNRTLSELLSEFKHLRENNIKELKSLNITEFQLKIKGIHPDFGSVTLAELIATWVAHDLGHIAQISRVMAKQYKNEVGPWVKYLRILNA